MALKLIHTADWHLGQTFFGYDREAEHEAFLGFLTNLLVERETDVLLIAGDVFDVTNPSAGAQRRFYRFLREANRLNPGLQIVIIAGNHDSGSRIELPAPLMRRLRTHALGHPGAHLRTPITLQEVLASKPIARPLLLLDCCPISDGAMALVVSDQPSDHAAVAMVGAGQAHRQQHLTAMEDVLQCGAGEAAQRAFDEAGLGLDDVDYLAIYDSFTITLTMLLEENSAYIQIDPKE